MATTIPARTESDPAVPISSPPESGRLPAAPTLAALMAGAGLIHFVMAPIHAADSQLEAALFALAGWTQVVLAILLVTRNRKAVLLAGAAANVAFIGVWAYSRTRGLPFGAHPNTVEQVGPIDGTAIALQASFVVGVAVQTLNRGRVQLTVAFSIAAAGAILGVATMVSISPDVAKHTDGPEATIDLAQTQLAKIESERCDKDVNPKAFWKETQTAGVDSVYGQGHLVASPAAGAAASGGHAHGGVAAAAPTTTQTLPAPDRTREASTQKESMLTQLSKGVGEANDARLVVELTKITDQEYDAWLRNLHTLAAQTHDSAAPDDNGGHGGHVGPNSWVAITDPQTCKVMKEQLAVARGVTERHPTAADATAAGWIKVTTYVPGIAAHYMNFKYVDDQFEVDKPEMILYDGEGPDARVIGLSYYIVKKSNEEPKMGFAGGNDHFHRHVGLCVKGTIVVADSQTSEEKCKELGGVKQGGSGGWMSHAWVVPGCESPWGIFSGANPLLDGALPKASGQDGGGCAASSVRKRYDLTPGERTPPPPVKSGSDVAAPR